MSVHKPWSERSTAAERQRRPLNDTQAGSGASWGEVVKVNEQRGSDPYNTSGSFDRKKNWARVGKR